MPPLFFGGDSYFFLYLQFLFFFSFAAFLALRTLQWAVRRRRRVERAPLVIGVFHPFADAGGGGERVLWRALAELIAMKRTAVAASDAMARARLLLYTGDAAAPAELLARAQARFGIDIGPDDVQCVRLHWRYWSTAEAWPRFTLLLQSVGGALVAAEAMWRAPADLYVDTLGYAFAYPVWTYVGGARVLCYTHYPVISADMLASVRERRADTVHNRSAAIARSPLLTQAKLLYYEAFALLYGACARRAHLALANSAWTAEHLARVWRTPRCTHAATHALHARPRSLLCVRIVYPPCDTRRLCQLPLESAARAGSQQLLSIAQFRPEKNHALQIRSLAHFLAAQPHRRAHCRLVLAGGCRHAGDEQRVRELRALALALGVEHNVAFEINCTFDRLLQLLAESLIGLHTMWNEHFGIGIVEFMAAGAIVIAHNSGGPALDIVTPQEDGACVGFLASDEAQYAAAVACVLALSEAERASIRAAARRKAETLFSDERFGAAFQQAIRDVW